MILFLQSAILYLVVGPASHWLCDPVSWIAFTLC